MLVLEFLRVAEVRQGELLGHFSVLLLEVELLFGRACARDVCEYAEQLFLAVVDCFLRAELRVEFAG